MVVSSVSCVTAPPSPDTWEYELSHVIDIYADDFVHRSLVALTSWPEVPEQDKIKAYNLLVGFVNELIERVGIHSLRSSTFGLNPDNVNLNYRSCQRAGSVIVADFGFSQYRLLLALLLLCLEVTPSYQCCWSTCTTCTRQRLFGPRMLLLPAKPSRTWRPASPAREPRAIRSRHCQRMLKCIRSWRACCGASMRLHSVMKLSTSPYNVTLPID